MYHSRQVYGGYSRLSNGTEVMHEYSTTNKAVDDTLDLIVKSGSTIVQTFFFSASGGHTANIEDSWSYSTPKSYYVGVDDPYETLAGCAVRLVVAQDERIGHRREAAREFDGRFGAVQSRSAGGSGGSTIWVTGITITRGVSDYRRWFYFHFTIRPRPSGKLSAYTVKSALGLKSPNFSFTGFPMSRIPGCDPLRHGGRCLPAAFGGTRPGGCDRER